MKNLTGLLMFAVSTTLAPGAAPAQDLTFGIRAGAVHTADVNSGRAVAPDLLAFKTGYSLSAGLGYSLPSGFGAEAELGFVRAPVKSDAGTSVSGSLKHYLVMANAYYHFAPAGQVRPFVSVGLGAARVNEDTLAFADLQGRFFHRDETRTAFAYQGRAGVSYDLGGKLVTLGYRLLRVNGGNMMPPTGVGLRTEALTHHLIELGSTF